MTSYRIANEQMGMAYRDVWTAAYVNDLPDSSFLYVDGTDRRFPVKDKNGKPDAAHIANAMARINQADLPEATRMALMKKAKAMAAAHPGIGEGTTKEYQGTAGSGRSKSPELVVCRSFDVDLMLRAGGDGRTVVGRAVPYGQTIDIDGGRERFAPGAFAQQIGYNQIGKIKLFGSHQSRLGGTSFGVGKTLSLEERADGLHGTWAMYETPAGDEALYMVKTGEVTGLSVGFKVPQGGTRLTPDGVQERQQAHLDHVALTTEPAYPEAKVLAVRSASPGLVRGLRTDQARHHALLDRLGV